MNSNIKLLFAAATSLFLSACASTPELNRDLVHQEKIKTINLDKMEQNINIQVADSKTTGAILGGLPGLLVSGAVDGNVNSKRKKALEPFHEVLNDINVNMVLKNALEHSMLDSKAFSEDVVINTEYDKELKTPYLIPILTPNVIMLGDYSGVAVFIIASTAQESTKKKQNKYKSVYQSEQLMDESLLAKREENKQYWKDNPLVLKEKIVDGIYDAAKQFADDFNADEADK